MSVTKQEIVEQIKRISDMDGATPGRQRFEAVTGIKRHEWYGLHCARWGDALQEAGLNANTLQGQFDRDQVLKAYVGLIEKLGRIPTEGDIRIERRSNKAFPSHSTIGNRIGLRGDRLIAALEHARENALGGRLQDLLAEAIASLPEGKDGVSDSAEPLSTVTTGFVYMMKSGKYCLGYRQTLKQLRNGKAKLVMIANNTPPLRFVFHYSLVCCSGFSPL